MSALFRGEDPFADDAGEEPAKGGPILMAIGDIKKMVADYMGTTVDAINSRNRLKNVALARQIAMFYSYLSGNTQEQVADKFDRVHTNVTHAVKKVKQWVNAIMRFVQCWKVSKASILS